MDQTFELCEDTICIADEIVIYGKSEKEHDKHMQKIISRCNTTWL